MTGLSTRETERLTRILTELPDLHAELVAVGETKPAAVENAGTRRTVPGSQAPLNLGRHVLLHGADSILAVLTAHTRNITIEARSADLDLPELAEQATVTSECAWLLAIRYHLIHQPWAPTLLADLATLHNRVRNTLGYTKQPKYICPQCGNQMHLQPGNQWFQCDTGHNIEATTTPPIRYEQPAPTKTICERFNITEDRLHQWKHRKKISPATESRGRTGAHWWPWDVYLILNPDLAAAIEAVEGLKTG